MHQRLLFVLLTLTLSTAFAQYSIRDPNAIPLHGEWQFALDPGGVGTKAGWYADKMQNQRWDKVTVPHCFSADPRYQFYNGMAWYRRTFPWQPTAGKRVLIHFDGSFYKTTVYLNDKPVGMHEGGYTPFVIDLTDYIQPGTNTLTVAVDNDTWKPGTIPGAKDGNQPNDSFTGWINYGGLIRPVYLTVEPPSLHRKPESRSNARSGIRYGNHPGGNQHQKHDQPGCQASPDTQLTDKPNNPLPSTGSERLVQLRPMKPALCRQRQR